VPSEKIKESNPTVQIKYYNLEIEDFFTFKDILGGAIEQFNSENYDENQSNKKETQMVTLKANPDLYKIYVGKKKTGLPNPDYPPLISDKKIKNSKFPVLSILYDVEHIDERNSCLNLDKENQKNKEIVKSSENIFPTGKNDLKENLISENIKKDKDYNFDSTVTSKNDEIRRSKKCCERCEIF
jgi:hypothetical protein